MEGARRTGGHGHVLVVALEDADVLHQKSIYYYYSPATQNTKMNTFAIVARTEKIIHANECSTDKKQKFSKGHFSCIDCKEDVFVRRGQKRIWHFAHYCDSHERKCTHKNGGETLEHYEAKHWIAKNLHACAFAVEECPTCRRKKCFVAKNNVLLHKCYAVVERKIPYTNRVADVLVIGPATCKPVAAIEMFHTHETDVEKIRECEAQGIAVLEITTEALESARDQHSFSSQNSLLVIDTTAMKCDRECVDCSLAREFNEEWQMAVDTYDLLEKRIWQLMEARTRGRDRAHTRIQEAEVLARRKKFKHSGKCVGKCKQCSQWMFEGQGFITVSSETMPKAAWNALFSGDDIKYRKSYMLSSHCILYNSIKVHSTCAMTCPCCHRWALLHKIAKYGMCYICNVDF